jgi:hypothetical protein
MIIERYDVVNLNDEEMKILIINKDKKINKINQSSRDSIFMAFSRLIPSTFGTCFLMNF